MSGVRNNSAVSLVSCTLAAFIYFAFSDGRRDICRYRQAMPPLRAKKPWVQISFSLPVAGTSCMLAHATESPTPAAIQDLDYEFYSTVLGETASDSEAGKKPADTIWVVGEVDEEDPLVARLRQEHGNVRIAVGAPVPAVCTLLLFFCLR